MILEGVRVIDLSRTFAGPLAAMMLGDLGADVIKVERPGIGDETRTWPHRIDEDRGTYFCALNRNKRSIVLDLADPMDRGVLYRLARTADLLIENFRPGVANRLGIDEASLHKNGARPGYLSVTGFGNGPYADLPAYDPILQAMGGFMSVTGEAGGPPIKSMIPVADLITGIHAYAAGLVSLLAKSRRGHPASAQLSMMDVMVSSLTTVGTAYLHSRQVPERAGRRNPARVPSTGVECSDGVYIQFVPNQGQWSAFCQAIDRPAWGSDERYATNSARIEHQAELYSQLESIFGARESHFWLDRLRSAGIPCGPVLDLEAVFSDGHVVGSGMVVPMDLGEHVDEPVQVLASPLHGLGRPPEAWLKPPHLGEHTEQILAELDATEDAC